MNSTAAEYRSIMVRTVSLGTFFLIAHAANLVHSSQPNLEFNRKRLAGDLDSNNAALQNRAVAGCQQQQQQFCGEVIESGMLCKQIPGLALAVVKDGKVLMSQGYGIKDLATKEGVTADTKFLVASLSKAFTATLLTNLVTGKPDMTRQMATNVYRVLGKDFKFNNTIRSTYATLEDLLAHRTGVPRNNYARLASDFSIHGFAGKIRYLPSKGNFRDSFYYNDLMYGLAAYITEKLNGDMPWKQQMRDSIFSKLGMANSTFVDDVDFNHDDVAVPYVREDGQIKKASVDFIKHWGRNLGSGNMVSSANDMAQWMLMLLNDGKDAQGKRVLREGVVEDTFTPQNVLPPGSDYKHRKPRLPYSFTSDNYGFGWRRGYYKGYQMMFHSGSSFGYRAYLTLLPEMDVGVVTLMTGSDTDYKFRKPLHMYLLDHALGEDPWINRTNICQYPDAWESPANRKKRSTDTLDAEDKTEIVNNEEANPTTRQIRKREAKRQAPSFPVNKYVGTYHNAAYGALHVSYNASMHSLVLEYGIGLWRLDSVGGHEFDGKWLKVPPTISGNFMFKTKTSNVIALEAVKFEPSKPPVFMKVGN